MQAYYLGSAGKYGEIYQLLLFEEVPYVDLEMVVFIKGKKERKEKKLVRFREAIISAQIQLNFSYLLHVSSPQ
jgi:hypothetical protein